MAAGPVRSAAGSESAPLQQASTTGRPGPVDNSPVDGRGPPANRLNADGYRRASSPPRIPSNSNTAFSHNTPTIVRTDFREVIP